MKRTIFPALILLALAGGCTTSGDKVIVNAERSIAVSFEAVDTFIQFDHQNRETMKTKYPDVHKAAEEIRVKAPPLFNSAWAALAAYKAQRTPETGDKLADSMAIVENLARTARQFLLKVNPPAK